MKYLEKDHWNQLKLVAPKKMTILVEGLFRRVMCRVTMEFMPLIITSDANDHQMEYRYLMYCCLCQYEK